jgi:hypothetical protein
MLTRSRSRSDSTYEYLELPDKKRVKKVISEKVISEKEKQENIQEPQPQPQPQPPQSDTLLYEYPANYKPLYEVNIDFDEAHREWVKNKIKMQNGCYKYKREKRSKK